ncbi:hypothetical protein PROFUN_02964 [Planoprotostelium fungivorum]|uniref:Uncharacterized protein n=1 Tax=Planoprotostelium fungivorum TaxID=1890364 RepID=A0A2P6NX65_9EUKA|nr:hypothetical protein PROFUN_02964 [Planoprotostelium fungivorum]
MKSILILCLIGLAACQYQQQNGILSPTTGTQIPLGSNFTLVVRQFGSMAVGGFAVNITITNVATKESHFYGQFRDVGYPASFNLIAPGASFGAGPANITVNDIVGLVQNDGSATIDPNVTPFYSVIVQLTGSNGHTSQSSSNQPAVVPTTTAAKACGVNEGSCDDVRVGKVCYDTTNYHCVSDNGKHVLCHKPDESCGNYCYDINLYTCHNGQLVRK